MPDRIEHLNVPAGAEFQLHAGEAGLKRLAHRREQRVDGLHLVKPHAHLDRLPLPAEHLVERLAGQSGVEVPPGGIQRRLGKPVAAESRQPLL